MLLNSKEKLHKVIQEQSNLLYIALTFLTRIPVPLSVNYSQDKLNQASRYFPLIGWFIGFLSALVFWLSQLILPLTIATLFSMLFGILLTGCFHEDGLADTSDGFGGGWEVQQKLNIMKDSRLGSYGATALWFSLAIKYALLSSLAELSVGVAILAMLSAHSLSRTVSTVMIFILPYVADVETSKVKPLAESYQPIDLIISLLIGALALLLLLESTLWLILVLVLFTYLMRQFLLRQIKGFTGDTLGATQQISELLIYTVILATVLPDVGQIL